MEASRYAQSGFLVNHPGRALPISPDKDKLFPPVPKLARDLLHKFHPIVRLDVVPTSLRLALNNFDEGDELPHPRICQIVFQPEQREDPLEDTLSVWVHLSERNIPLGEQL